MDPGFEVNRRWEEHSVAEVTPAGVYFKQREWYAYLDENKREWEYSRFVDLTLRKNSIDKANRRRLEDEGKFIESYWRHLPRAFQARLKVFGFVYFESMLIIDEKGDPACADSHIFIDFNEKYGPFEGFKADLEQSHQLLDNGGGIR